MGTANISKGEWKIISILKKEGIEFVREKTFTDSRNSKYRYDFYIEGLNILIEVNGEQHYKYTPFFFSKKSDWLKSCERDRIKISYALARDIKLFIIPFWELDNLQNFNDIKNHKFLAKTKFHNDIVWREHQNIKG